MADEKKDEWKGRDTLVGLDQTMALILLDKVQDADLEGALPEVLLSTDPTGNFSRLTYSVGCGQHPLAIRAEDRLARLRCNTLDPPDESPDVVQALGGLQCSPLSLLPANPRIPCPWVDLRWCPAWVKQEFARRWSCRYVARELIRPAPSRWETRQVFPIRPVVAWFRELWPDAAMWGSRAEKYLAGYTAAWVRARPGVGARLRALPHGDHPPGVYTVTDLVAGRPAIQKEDQQCRVNAVPAHFEVVD